MSPTELLIGIASRGGALLEEWRAIILSAVEHRLDIVSGLHDYLSDEPEISSLAEEKGVKIWDIRRPRPSVTAGTGKAREIEATVILTVGTDCNVGKMTVSLELYRAARKAGISTAWRPPDGRVSSSSGMDPLSTVSRPIISRGVRRSWY